MIYDQLRLLWHAPYFPNMDMEPHLLSSCVKACMLLKTSVWSVFFPNSWRKLLVGACSAKDMRHISAVLCSKFVTIIQNQVARTYHISI